jgi:F-type H+-transporting ATPase subunit alpha
MHNYNDYSDLYKEFGVVQAVYHDIIMISGLPNVTPKEMVIFENNERGQVLSIHEYNIEVIFYGRNVPRVGSKVLRTGIKLKIQLSENLLGHIVNPFGEIVDESRSGLNLNEYEEREIDTPPPGIEDRRHIKQSLLTGVSMIDISLPLGKGQRELILGDRKTGKSSLLLSILKNQAKLNTICVYVIVGKRSHETRKILEFIKQEELMDNIILLMTGASDPAPAIYLSPFSGMTIAEYFRDKGRDVLLILDDLTTHAQICRQLSLLAKRFPGRDSYPGNIFYTHSRLLERAGNFINETGGTNSITCLPVAETIENDMSHYIVSNLIGITDGHILLDTNEFIKGRRPAINTPLSVTRVGKQTQSRLLQEINIETLSFISRTEKVQKFAHLGSELNDEAKEFIEKGKKLFSFFNQPPEIIIPLNLQITFITMIYLSILSGDPVLVHQYRDNIINNYFVDDTSRNLIDEMGKCASYNDLKNKVNENKDALLKLCIEIKK